MMNGDQRRLLDRSAGRQRLAVRLLLALVLAGSLVGVALWADRSVRAADATDTTKHAMLRTSGTGLISETGNEVSEMDLDSDLVATRHTGSSRFTEFVQLASSLGLNVTVGTDSSVCAVTDAIAVEPGTAVTYCYEVTNTGLTILTRHDLVDSRLGAILNGFTFSLTPGATVFLTQTAVLTQSVVNSATWTAYNPGPTDVTSATDSVSVTVVSPSIALTTTVGTDASVCAVTDAITVGSGTAVTYCYEVTNTGLTTLTRHDLEDSRLGVILDGFTFSLMPGATVFLTQTAVLTQSVVNSATWMAYNPGLTDVTSATDSASVTVVSPSIALTTTVGTDAAVCAVTDAISVEPASAVTYCYEVTNTGLTMLTRHDLVDSRLGVILDGFTFSLMPGATVFLTQTAVLTQSVVNSATWTAYNPGPVDAASAVDSASVTVSTGVGADPPEWMLYLPLVIGGE